MPKLFGVTLFVSATLLFLVQPMVGKMILPLLGGTPAVWNTCMVFYQALLLAGYYYAHKTTGALPPRRQVAVHAGVLLAATGALAVAAAVMPNHSPVPVVKDLAPQGSSVPFFGVIALLVVAIGLPFFTVSATAPLLQKWFSETGHPSAKDPYFLYAASNFGSLLALVAYPFVVEPNLTLVQQARLWAVGFVVLLGLIMACGNAVKNAPPRRAPAPNPVRATLATARPSRSTRLRWLFLAAVPSSLMLAVNTDVTADIVSMPLLWIIPLALYLLTFVIVFSKSVPSQVHLYVTLMTPVIILLMVFLRTSKNVEAAELVTPFKLTLALELGMFFIVALACHGELARTRPSTDYLTEFYLIMSVGGMLGGLFNALVAPLVFEFVTEYPVTIVAACFLLPPLRRLLNPDMPVEGTRWTVWDLVLPLLFFAGARILSWQYVSIWQACDSFVRRLGADVPAKTVATVIVFGIPALACYFLVDRPVRFGACVAALWLGTFVTSWLHERNREDEYRTTYTRSYFGTIRVETSRYDKARDVVQLIHGTTVHGSQFKDDVPYEQAIEKSAMLLGATTPADALGLAYLAQPELEFPGRDPISYYHRSGPVGVMFDAVRARETGRPTDVACIGLGTGSLSAYGRPGQKMTFFEIDWTVRNLVEHPKHFTFIDRARGQGTDVEFVMGDARLSLEQTDHKWGFMLVDAFSSDSIPAHLLTKQAVELYFNRLNPDGLLALHISNRYLDLEPVVEHIVRDLGLAAVVMHDRILYEQHWPMHKYQPETSGKLSSSWIAVARTKQGLRPLLDDERWVPLRGNPRVGLWTDDYTPIKNVLEGDWNLFGD